MRPFQLGRLGAFTREAYKAVVDDEAVHRATERKVERQLRAGLNEWVQTVLPDITEANASVIAQQLRDGDLYFRDVLQDALTYSADLGTNMAVDGLESVGMGFDYTLANVEARDWARQYTNQLMRDLNVTNDTIVGESVSRWMENQQPIQALRDDIAQRVPGAYGRNRSKRAELIARTEVTRAIAEGNLAAYRASGVVSGMEWITKNDEIVCPYCGSLNGKIVSIDGARFFDALTPELQAKLGTRTFVTPPAHPGCRCQIGPVVMEVPVEVEPEPVADVAPTELPMATSVKDAERIAKEHLGIDADYTGLTTDQANQVNRGAKRTQDIYDGPAARSRIITKSSGNSADAYAEFTVANGGEIHIYPSNIQNIDKQLQRTSVPADRRINRLKRELANVDSQPASIYKDKYVDGLNKQMIELEKIASNERLSAVPFHESQTLEDVIAHEFGHGVHADLQNPIERNATHGITDFMYSETGTSKYGSNQLQRMSRNQPIPISEYSTTNGNEFMAESFNAFAKGDKDRIDPGILKVFERLMTK